MAINTKLHQLGLHKSEISVYLFLIRHGRSTTINVSRGTKIARPNCYHVLHQLLSKGLISEEYVKGKRTYTARDANAVITYAEKRTRLAEKISVDLAAMIRHTSLKPQIEFVEGDDEVGQFLEGLRSQKQIILFGATPTDPSILANFIKSLKAKTGGPTFKHVEPRKQIPTYFLLWHEALAVIPVSSQSLATIIYNQSIFETISNLVNG